MTPEEIAAMQADNEGLKQSLLKVQVDLDAALQREKDVAAAHAAELSTTKQGYDAEINDLHAQHAQELDALKTAGDAAVQAKVDELSAQAAQFQAILADREQQRQADLAAQSAQLRQQHDAEIARLKAEVLLPAIEDLQARQLADLQAKHEAARQALLNP